MAKNGTEFSKYATSFYKIIEGEKSDFDIFTKELLKMGLIEEDKDYIDDEFPTIINEQGKRSIADNKGDRLRKYFKGINDLSKLISVLETDFNSDFQQRYCEELQYNDDSRIREFAQCLKLDVNVDDIDIVSKAIADYYTSLIKRAATKKRTKTKTSKDNPKTEGNNISLSFTITETEKKALVRLCELIKTALRKLKQQTDIICNKQHELKKLNNSKDDKSWVPHLEFEIKSSIKRLNEDFSVLENFCNDLVILLKPKTDMDAEFPKLILFANNIRNDEYKITCPDEFKYNPFNLMISNFNDCIEHVLHVIDKL